MGILINRIKRILSDEAEKVYIVGGTIRDRILNVDISDYDFAVLGDAASVSKLVCDKLKGSYVPYAEDRGTYRVVYENVVLDFTQIRGENIDEDLIHRDFTINAMAIRLNDFFDVDLIIDPLGGLKDLREKKIKCVGKSSFDDDPLRMLRAIRFAAKYNFSIDEDSKNLIKEKADLIKNVSSERIMSEIYSILKSKESFKYVQMMDELGLIDALFPEIAEMKEIGKCYYQVLDSWHHSIKTIEEYETIVNDLRFPSDIENLVKKYLDKDLSSGNKLKDVLKLAAMFHEIGKKDAIYIDSDNRLQFYNHDVKGEKIVADIAKRLKLAKKEASLIKKMVLYHVNPFSLYIDGTGNKALFKFFSDLEENAIGCLLLSLADVTSAMKGQGRLNEASCYRNFITKLLRRYMDFEKTKTPLLTPLDIIVNFDLKDYKLLNQILYELRKNQFYGEIESREDAVKFVEERMKMEKI
ncbi:MAG TPA: CCA tRNA nucleotidyltransferase [Thermoanaerobacterium sp.]|nr:CCA tRNA nucleotidyltransferase [Thermoanaerobacterium sp.]